MIMNASLTHYGRAAIAAHAPLVAGAWSHLRQAWQRWRAARASQRRLAELQAAVAGLDDALLRDIGLHRCEASSYWAESEGLVPRTRRRLPEVPRTVT
jgi:uncharacterized protein YjiS (DUF1127 family)